MTIDTDDLIVAGIVATFVGTNYIGAGIANPGYAAALQGGLGDVVGMTIMDLKNSRKIDIGSYAKGFAMIGLVSGMMVYLTGQRMLSALVAGFAAYQLNKQHMAFKKLT